LSRVFRTAKRPLPPIQAPEISGDSGGYTAERVYREAERTLEEARQEASRLLEEANQEREAIVSRARAQGFDRGHKDGMEVALLETETLLEQAVQTLEQSKASFETMQKEAEPMLVAIAMDTAEKIVGDALAFEPELVLSMVRAGMAALKGETKFLVRVKPALRDILEGAKETLRQESGAKEMEVTYDESLGDGCVVKTPHGFVDLRVETQIENVAQALDEARKRLMEDSVS
jgi:flagellar assembly protein FliH